jgi:hypothetical protein
MWDYPRISDASIITAFRQGLCDEKMLEKLAMHDVDDVTTLFALADKCARAAEGRAWHSEPQVKVTKVCDSDVVTQGGGRKKKRNKSHGREKPRFAVLVAAAVARGQGKRSKRPRPQGDNGDTCPVHPKSRHRAADCHEIIKLARRISERREQSFKDDTSPHHRPSQRGADGKAATVEGQDLGYQSPEGCLKDVFTRDSDSSDDGDRRKKLYVMYDESWELTSRRSVKSLRREVLSAVSGVPKTAPHQRWRGTTISFVASDCPDNMVGAVKGKCALGPFLSILVIECQHKCLNVNLCPWVNKVQIKSKGMFLSLSTLVLCTNIFV